MPFPCRVCGGRAGGGREGQIGRHEVETLPTLHPAYLLRNPAAKQQAWKDMLSLKMKMAEFGLD